eukprot:7376528-Prymnesium_polylepis.2
MARFVAAAGQQSLRGNRSVRWYIVSSITHSKDYSTLLAGHQIPRHVGCDHCPNNTLHLRERVVRSLRGGPDRSDL